MNDQTQSAVKVHRTYLCLGGPLAGQRYAPSNDARRFHLYLRVGKLEDYKMVYRERLIHTEDGVVAFWLCEGVSWVEGFTELAAAERTND